MKFNKKKTIFGRHPVLDALQNGTPIDKILLQQGTRGDFEKQIRQLCRINNTPLQVAPKERLNREASGNHQGVIGFLSLLTYYRLEDVLPGIYESSETPLILLLDGVTDVRNFGAIARTAECCGVHALVIPKKKSAQINADAIKSSAGALTKIPVCRENSIEKTIELLRLSGVQVLASDLQAKEKIFDLDFKLPTAIIMGSESKGIHPSLLQKADKRFIIPQLGTTDSFNVSVATGIILYESLRQRISRKT